MIKAIVTHKSENMAGLMTELEKIKSKKSPEADIQLSVIEDSILDWASKNRIGTEEMLAIWFQEKKGDEAKKRRTKPTFSVNMMKIDRQPGWVDSFCWKAVLHNPEEGVVRAMAGQLWGDYIRNFDERIKKDWAPWGALPQNSSWALPGDGNQKGIEIGKRIDKALVDLGLVYDSDLSTTWRSGIEYFEISQSQFDDISKLVEIAFSFRRALTTLYSENEWARQIFNIGRPKYVCEWALKGLRNANIIPQKVRLDIAIDTNEEPLVTEFEMMTPGGEGIEMGMRRIYLDMLGDPLQGYLPMDVADGYEQMVRASTIEGPIMFLITSDAPQYFPEQKLKAKVLAERGIKIIVCGPEDVAIEICQGKQKIFAKGTEVFGMERFFETYELSDSLLYTLAEISENGFYNFSPCRDFCVEGKEGLAFLHEPSLRGFWEKQMGQYNFEFLKEHTPLTVFPVSLTNFSTQLEELKQKDSWYRKRASMGDDQCWGSRGVVFGKKENQEEWERQLFQDRYNFLEGTFPYNVYQQAIAHHPYRISFYNRSEGRVMEGKFFVRLTPWGYSTGDGILTCGNVATFRNDPKVHGAKDAVQTVSVIVPG